MRGRIANRFIINYTIMFFISIMVAVFAFLLLCFSNHLISKELIKNNITADSIMKDDYRSIDATGVVENSGGVQVVDNLYKIVYSEGINTFSSNSLTITEFTEFLVHSKSKKNTFNYSIKYNSKEQFWLIVTFPVSIRINFGMVQNTEYISNDMNRVVSILIAILIFYLLLLAISTVIYSKITSFGFVRPLKKLCNSAKKLRDGDYSARVTLNLNNEFGELEETFNAMAEKIEMEMKLRQQSEENRKKLILDISHDLKNPLTSIMGYAERSLNKSDLSDEDKMKYLQMVYNNSIRANGLIENLFEISKLDSPEFKLKIETLDICEFLRIEISKMMPMLEEAEFEYDFDIPEEEVYVGIDTNLMDRALYNLVANAVKYNKTGTEMNLQLVQREIDIAIVIKDNGIGIPEHLMENIFKPFVRDDTSNKVSGGTGLGLSITQKIIHAHNGSIELSTNNKSGSEFIIILPKI